MNTSASLFESLNARQNEYRYLLLDPLKKVAEWNLLHVDNLRKNYGNDSLTRVLRPDLAWSPGSCPLLLLIASPGGVPDRELVQYSEEYARGEALYEKRHVCGWMTSALAPDAMATWLATLCGNIKPGSVIPVFEPLRLELLEATASPLMLSGRLDAVSQWHLMSSAGELKTLNGQRSEEDWILSWGIERAQNDARNLWRLLSAWDDAGDCLPADAVRRASGAWLLSGQYRLHHLSDRLYLALNILTLPTDITQHADIQTRLQQASNDESLYFEQLMQSLPDAVWSELRHA